MSVSRAFGFHHAFAVADGFDASAPGLGLSFTLVAGNGLAAGNGLVVAGDGRCASEAIALVIGDQLVIGEPLLVQLGALLTQLGLSSLLGRLVLGDASPVIGDVGPLGQIRRGFAMLSGLHLATLLDLALTSP